MTPAIRVAHVATIDLTLRFLLLGQMQRLRDEGYDVTAISAPGPWTSELEAEGIRFVAWPHATRAWSPGGDVRAFFELVRILRKGGFDLVHTHTPKPGILGRPAARAAGIPCVANTVHGFYARPGDPADRRFAVMTLERIAGCAARRRRGPWGRAADSADRRDREDQEQPLHDPRRRQ